MLQFMDAFFQAAEESGEQESGENSCESEIDNFFHYFCGSVTGGQRFRIRSIWHQYCQEKESGDQISYRMGPKHISN